jgi:hypothetical protein
MAEDTSFYFGQPGSAPEPVEFTFEYYLDYRARIEAEVSSVRSLARHMAALLTFCESLAPRALEATMQGKFPRPP